MSIEQQQRAIDDPAETASDTLTADQRAIADYFASDRYQRGLAPPRSGFRDGLVGIAALGCIAGVVSGCVNWDPRYADNYAYLVGTIIHQSLMVPSVVWFCFAIVVPFLWHGAVIARGTLAVAMTLPGLMTLYAILPIVSTVTHDELFVFSTMVISFFLTAACVTLVAQMFTPWSLSALRRPEPRSLITPMRSLFGLILLVAVGLSVVVTMEDSGAILEIMMAIGSALVASITTLLYLITRLHDDERSIASKLSPWLFASGIALAINGLTAIAQFGSTLDASDILVIAASSAYGTLAIVAVLAVHTAWLRAHGWRCIDQRRMGGRSTC